MPAPTVRPAADPLDDIDREASGVDSLMARQDRADTPGERSDEPAGDGDVYLDAAREVSAESEDPDQAALDADRDAERIAAGVGAGAELDFDGDTDMIDPAEVGLGADDDDPIDETERAGDDSIR